MASRNYPGHFVRVGEPDAAIVAAVQSELRNQGYGPFPQAAFDEPMRSVVRLFQSQHVDREGRPLDTDGVIGPLTWAAIFGVETSPKKVITSTSAVLMQTVNTARAELGVMEQPPGSNRGPRVDQYLQSVGIGPNDGTADQRFWCMAFAYFCANEAAKRLGVPNRLAKTAGVLDQWNRCLNRPDVRCIAQDQAKADPQRVRPGQLLIIDHGHGLGHTGIVVAIDGPHLSVVEGNASGRPNDRNGVGVFQTEFHSILDQSVRGFIDCDP